MFFAWTRLSPTPAPSSWRTCRADSAGCRDRTTAPPGRHGRRPPRETPKKNTTRAGRNAKRRCENPYVRVSFVELVPFCLWFSRETKRKTVAPFWGHTSLGPGNETLFDLNGTGKFGRVKAWFAPEKGTHLIRDSTHWMTWKRRKSPLPEPHTTHARLCTRSGEVDPMKGLGRW